MAASSGALQRMLISRLEKQIEDLKKANEALAKKLQKNEMESAAKIYHLEEEKDSAEKSIENLEENLEDAKMRLRRIDRIGKKGRRG
jgi:predicted  nucleic acid-binding Zn-ribbon protein